MAENYNQSRSGSNSSSRGGGRRRPESAPKEFEERVVEINRVTRVVKGGKRMRFRALVVIGDKKGKVAYGLGKATDVTTAVAKAVTDAKKDMRTVFLNKGTLPYLVEGRHKSAHVLIKPAQSGTGLIAGGPVRVVLDLVGVKDAAAKMLGSSNKVSNIVATIDALSQMISPKVLFERRGTKSSQDRGTKSSQDKDSKKEAQEETV